ncbi:hypothetical protein Tco_0589703, partial [Tanacetum coccineum]
MELIDTVLELRARLLELSRAGGRPDKSSGNTSGKSQTI